MLITTTNPRPPTYVLPPIRNQISRGPSQIWLFPSRFTPLWLIGSYSAAGRIVLEYTDKWNLTKHHHGAVPHWYKKKVFTLVGTIYCIGMAMGYSWEIGSRVKWAWCILITKATFVTIVIFGSRETQDWMAGVAVEERSNGIYLLHSAWL